MSAHFTQVILNVISIEFKFNLIECVHSCCFFCALFRSMTAKICIMSHTRTFVISMSFSTAIQSVKKRVKTDMNYIQTKNIVRWGYKSWQSTAKWLLNLDISSDSEINLQGEKKPEMGKRKTPNNSFLIPNFHCMNKSKAKWYWPLINLACM